MKFTVEGPPCSKNAAYDQRHGSGGLKLTPKAEAFIERIRAAAVNAGGHARPWFTGPGIVVITEAHFTRDADAGAVSALVQDALQGIAYTNDSQVLFAGGWKGDPDPANPRTEVTVAQLEAGADAFALVVPRRVSSPGPASTPPAMRDLADALTPGRREARVKAGLKPNVRRFNDVG